MEINKNNNIEQLYQEAANFKDNNDKTNSLIKITTLFKKINENDKKEAIKVIKDKVLTSITPSIITNDYKPLREALKILGKAIPENYNEIKIGDQVNVRLSMQEMELIEVIKGAHPSEKKLELLENLMKNYSGDLNNISLAGLNLSKIVILEKDPALAKYLLPKLNNFQKPSPEYNTITATLEMNDTIMLNILIEVLQEKKSNGSLPDDTRGQNIALSAMYSQIVSKDKLAFIHLLNTKKFDFEENPSINLLSHAIKLQEKTLIHYFLDNNIDINNKDIEEGPPIYQALLREDSETLEILLNKGADTSSPNCKKRLPFEYAFHHVSDEKIFDLLLIYKAPTKSLHYKTDVNPLSALKMLRLPNYKEKAKILKSYTDFKQISDKELKTKLVAFTHSIKGSSPINIKNENVKANTFINLEGAFGTKNFKIIAKSLEESVEYLNHYDLIKNSSSSYQQAIEALLFTSQNPPHRDLFNRYKKGEWVLIDTGFETHAVTIVFKKDLLNPGQAKCFICNRGAAMTTAVHSFTFDSEKLTTSIIKKLREKNSRTEKDYKKVVFEDMHKKLSFKHEKTDEITDKLCELEDQTVGNCSYSSPEMAAKLIIMQEIFKEKNIVGDKLMSAGPAAASLISQDFENVRRLTRLQHLHAYLNLHEEEGFKYSIDLPLVQKALSILWSGKDLHPLIRQEIEKVEKRFLKLSGNKQTISYQSLKIFYESMRSLSNFSFIKIIGF